MELHLLFFMPWQKQQECAPRYTQIWNYKEDFSSSRTKLTLEFLPTITFTSLLIFPRVYLILAEEQQA